MCVCVCESVGWGCEGDGGCEGCEVCVCEGVGCGGVRDSGGVRGVGCVRGVGV